MLLHLFTLALTTFSQSPPTQPTSSLLYILGAFCAGGALTIVYNIIQRFRRGQIEDTELINRITQQTVQGADDILQQYRVEVEVVRRQVEDYRNQLHKLTQELAQATLRIAHLETELSTAHANQERLRQQLADAVTNREGLEAEVKELRLRIAKFEKAVTE